MNLRFALSILIVAACDPPKLPPQQTPLTGTLVRDCSGAALAGVEVIAAQLPVKYGRPLMSDLPYRELRRATTDSAGKFALEFDSSQVTGQQSVSAVRADGGVGVLISGPLGTAPQYDPPFDHHDLGRLLLDGQDTAVRLELKRDTGFPPGSSVNLAFSGGDELVVETVSSPDAGVVLERNFRLITKVRSAQDSGIPDDAFQLFVRATLVDAAQRVLQSTSQTARYSECQTQPQTIVLQF